MALLKSAQSFVPLRLRTVSVDHGGVKAIARQRFGNAFRAALCTGENQRLAGFLIEQLAQRVHFFIWTDFVRRELYTFRRLEHGTERYAHWFPHVFMHQGGYR